MKNIQLCISTKIIGLIWLTKQYELNSIFYYISLFHFVYFIISLINDTLLIAMLCVMLCGVNLKQTLKANT